MMKRISFVLAFVVVMTALLLALCVGPSAAGTVPVECESSTLGGAYPDSGSVQTLAQGFKVNAAMSITSFTARLVSTLGTGAIASAQLRHDAEGAPGEAVSSGSFNVSGVSFAEGSLAQQPVYAAAESGGEIALEAGNYWLVLQLPVGMAWTHGTFVSENTNAPLVFANYVQQTSGGAWIDASFGDGAAATAFVSFAGCLAPSPSASPSPSPSPFVPPPPSSSPSPSPSMTPSASPSLSAQPSPPAPPSASPSASASPSNWPSPSASPSASASPSHSPSASASPSISPSPSASPSESPSASATPSNSPSPSETPSASPTPSITPSTSPSASVTPSISPSPSVTPSVSPSVLPTPIVVAPLDVNVTASFDLTKPSVSLAAGGLAGVDLEFKSADANNVSIALDEFDTSQVTETDPSGEELTTYVYGVAAADDGASDLTQGFVFHNLASTGDFGGLVFDIGRMALKWTVNLTTDASGGQPLGPFVLRYTITGTIDTPDPLASDVIVRRATPQADITTYMLPLTTTISTAESADSVVTTTRTIVALVQMFDRVMVDDVWMAASHSIVRTSAPGADRPQYTVELRLPAFARSLHYDPSLNMGTLLSTDERSRDGGGGDNMGLIIGVAVAIPLAILFVIAVILIIVGIAWHRKRRARQANLRRRSVINFNDL